jgi:hypothetical protein
MSEAFLTGFALAAAVALLLFPLSSRTAMFGQLIACINSLRVSINLTPDLPKTQQIENENSDQTADLDSIPNGQKIFVITQSPALVGTFNKLSVDMASAKHEIAYGNIDPADIDQLSRLLRPILVPTIALGLKGEVFQELRASAAELLGDISQMIDLTNAGLDHARLRLQSAQIKKVSDIGDAEVQAGSPGFTDFLKKSLNSFKSGLETISSWYRANQDEDGINSGNDYIQDGQKPPKRFDQQQLYVILFVRHLIECRAIAVIDLIEFLDRHHDESSNNRIILPNKIFRSILLHLKHAEEDPGHTVVRSRKPTRKYDGSFSQVEKEIEHLFPATRWERYSHHLRTIARALRSPESVFGLRVTLATLSVGIACFLHISQTFFLENRLAWALVFSTIGMSWTSGQSVFGLLIRVVNSPTIFTFIPRILKNHTDWDLNRNCP